MGTRFQNITLLYFSFRLPGRLHFLLGGSMREREGGREGGREGRGGGGGTGGGTGGKWGVRFLFNGK